MRLTSANGVLFSVPQVVGFTLAPTFPQSNPSVPLLPQIPTTSCCMLRHSTSLHTTQHRRQGAPLTAAATAWMRTWPSYTGQGRLLEGNKTSRRRPWWATGAASSTATTVMAAAPPKPGSSRANEAEVESLVRFAIVGANADEVGVRTGERYGYAVTSMQGLMEGRKGRKTDTVKAKAVARWLAEADVVSECEGGILTGFPETPEQVESLKRHGVSFDKLVVIHEPQHMSPGGDKNHESAGQVQLANVEALSGKEAERYSEISKHMLELDEGKLAEVSDDGDMETLCNSAAVILGLTELSDSGGRYKPVLESPGSSASTVGGKQEGVHHISERHRGTGDDKPPLCAGMTESSLDERISTMSPAEHASAKARHPAAYESAVRAAKAGVETKRALKQLIKEKKKAANEAQQLDTPFYLAVTGNKRKSRIRTPVPTIPSRITERLSSAATGDEEERAANTRVDFGGLVLDSPASNCLMAADITEPTGIQQAGMKPILDGESVILHAMTGSGKTLTFLLPLMQRWAPSFFSSGAPTGSGRAASAAPTQGDEGAFRVLLALPTRELAVQVAREAVLLAGGVTASVELLVDSGVHHDLGAVTAPIVIGSAKIVERIIRKSRPTVREIVLSRIKCIVVDEVDRLVDVLPKHAPPREVEKRQKHARPIAALLQRVLQTKPDVQVVACSATIGRPLRRELAHIINSAAAVGATAVTVSAGSRDRGADGPARPIEEGRGDLRVIRDSFSVASDASLSTERAVTIPESIRHYCAPLADGGFFSRLETLTATIRELQPRRPLVFVPPDERVTAVVAHLRRTGGDIGRRAMALHEAMGFGSDDEGGVRGMHSSQAIQKHDTLTGDLRGALSKGADTVATIGDIDRLSQASSFGKLGEGETGAILVTSEDSARGLHFDDVDFVFLMQKPKSPDEYVHLAGRTGRQGKTGNVVSLVSYEEYRKMQTWSHSLKIYYEKIDTLVTRR